MPRTAQLLWPRAILLLAIVLGSVVLFFNVTRYWPFISDDALISLRYAKRLLDGHGLTWTAGYPVEGYSNLLWVLLAAGVGLFGVDLVTAVRALGVLGTLTVMFVVAREYAGRGRPSAAWLPTLLALLFLSLSGPIAVWTIGGLEQPLQAALLAASISLTFFLFETESPGRPTAWWLSLALGLLCLTRPDGALFSVAVAVSIFCAAWTLRRRSLMASVPRVMLLPAMFIGSQLTFRWFYYGELLPNPALVKLPRSTAGLSGGVEYLSAGLSSFAPFQWLFVAGVMGLLVGRPTRAKGILLTALAVSWSAYVVFIGGDIFPAYRHLVPLVVILAYGLAEGAVLLVERLAGRGRLPSLVAAAAILLPLIPYAQRQNNDKQNQRAVRERWEWDCRDLALFLKRSFERHQPLTAVTAAGCLPFWSELPSLDLLGLNDYYIPRHASSSAGTGFIGHELGDGRYTLDRNPDLIVFNVGTGPHFRIGEELNGMAEFHERYIPVALDMEIEGVAPIFYANRYSEKVGITSAPDMISIPGFLFTGEGTRAVSSPDGSLVARLRGSLAAVTFQTAAAIDQWQVQVRGAGPSDVSVQVQRTGSAVTVTLRPNQSPIDVHAVVLADRR